MRESSSVERVASFGYRKSDVKIDQQNRRQVRHLNSFRLVSVVADEA